MADNPFVPKWFRLRRVKAGEGNEAGRCWISLYYVWRWRFLTVFFRGLVQKMSKNWLHDPDVTNHINALVQGAADEKEDLTQRIYATLRTMSRSLTSSQKSPVVDPTELVHEAFLTLFQQDPVTYANRGHFFGVASRMMRQIIVQAWREETRRRGAEYCAVIPLDDNTAYGAAGQPSVLDFDMALTWLEKIDPLKARVVELRIFSGLKHAEIAELLNLPLPKIWRLWKLGRAFLIRRLLS